MSAEEELVEIERRWVELERRRRELSDERIRAVWHAVDSGMSHGQVAKAMSSAAPDHRIARGYVTKILACGYPEP